MPLAVKAVEVEIVQLLTKFLIHVLKQEFCNIMDKKLRNFLLLKAKILYENNMVIVMLNLLLWI